MDERVYKKYTEGENELTAGDIRNADGIIIEAGKQVDNRPLAMI
ncbi:hypothetical protein ACT3HK_10925 [Thermolongibacillus altinsuensis]